MRISDWSSDVCASDLFVVGVSAEADGTTPRFPEPYDIRGNDKTADERANPHVSRLPIEHRITDDSGNHHENRYGQLGAVGGAANCFHLGIRHNPKSGSAIGGRHVILAMWQGQKESNLQPSVLETDALTIERSE